jgi:hypothetical protein
MSRRRAATRGLIAAPWTPPASLCCRGASNAPGSGWCAKAERGARRVRWKMEFWKTKTRGLDAIGFIEASAVGYVAFRLSPRLRSLARKQPMLPFDTQLLEVETR